MPGEPSEAPLPHHVISHQQLDALASGVHDSGALAALRALERSRRLLALRKLVHLTRQSRRSTGPLAPVDEAWTLLVEAERKQPDVMAELTWPYFGVWVAYVLRRLRGKAHDTAPLWFHVGQLHTLAAAAAFRAELPFQLAVPLWNGVAVLPGTGSVEVPAQAGWTHARLVFHRSTLTIDGVADSCSWRPIRNFADHYRKPSLSVRLDDMGPYRGLDIPDPPVPLSDAEVKDWHDALTRAWNVLVRDHQHAASELSEGLEVITPRPGGSRFRPHSASVGEGVGGAIVAGPHDAAQLAVTLVHEFQHSKLNAVNHFKSLTTDDAAIDCYAPWRDDARGSASLYQGVYAFTAVAEFWSAHREQVDDAEQDLANFEFALVRSQVTAAVEALVARPSLTDVGRRFAERLRDRVIALHSAEVPVHILDAAGMATLDHQIGWRLLHRNPDSGYVRKAIELRHAGLPAPRSTASVLAPDSTPRRLDVKAVLIRARLVGKEEFEGKRALLGTAAQDVADADQGDFALVEGDAVRALDLYRAEIANGSHRPGAWSGLGLALRATGQDAAANAIVEHPELVKALYVGLTESGRETPDVGSLAAWIGSAG